MKAKDLRGLGVEELRGKQRELSQECFNLRFQKATGQLGNTAMITKTKRDLARVKTVLRDLEMVSGSDQKRLQ